MPVTLRLHPVRACRRCQCDFVPANGGQRFCRPCNSEARSSAQMRRRA